MCASARKDDMMQECMNRNNICVWLRLVSMCVFSKAVSNNVCVQESVLQETTKKTARRTMEEELAQKLRIKGNWCQTPARLERDAHQETAEEDVVCGAVTGTEAPDRRELVPARPKRDAHQETAEEDAVCGAEAGRMC